MQFEKLLFDVSGTLWDDKEQAFNASYNVLRSRGHCVFPGTGEHLTVQGLKRVKVNSCDELFRYFGMKGSEKKLYEMYTDALDDVANEFPAQLYDGIDELLSTLNGTVQKVVISAHPQHRLEIDMDRFGIYDEFDRIIGSLHNKTEPIKENSKNTFAPYIGDSVSDIVQSRNAGVLPIAVTYGYGKREDLLKHNIELFSCPYALKDYLLEKV